MNREERLKAIAKWADESANPPTVPAVANRCEACREDFTGCGDLCPTCLLLVADTLKASAEEGWRPIETAPKDGTDFLAYSQDLGANDLTPFISLCSCHPDAGFCTCEIRTVTHWRPLPSPPITQSKGGG
jgi:hypothetical protein